MKMRSTTIKIGLLLAGSMLAANAHAACSAADQAALEKFDRDWSEAGRTGDRAALEAIFADGYSNLSPGAAVDRKTAIDDAVEQAEKDRAKSEPTPETKHDFYVVNCTGNSATITHRNTITSGTGDTAKTLYTRSVHQLEKIGGKWQVVSDMGHPLGDVGQVRYMDLEWNIAELNQDKTWFQRNLADDYSGVGSRDGAFEDKETFLESFGKYKVSVAETRDLDVRVDGDRAIATGLYLTQGTDDKGATFDRRSRFTDVFIKRDGRWQIWSSQGTEVED